MRKVTCSMSVSLDGYISGPDGGFDWGPPSVEVFNLAMDELKQAGTHILGRKLYESMVVWESAGDDPASEFGLEPALAAPMVEFAGIWRRLPKVVFSTTLTEVRGNSRLLSGGVVEEIERLRAEPGEGNIAIGGPTLAAEAAAHGLIDEYWIRVYPVLVGGGTAFFPQAGRQTELTLLESRPLANGVVYSRYRTSH